MIDVLDRVIRVRRVRARLALAALGRVQARRLAETQLLERVETLVRSGGAAVGAARAGAMQARAAGDAMLAGVADDVARRLARTAAEQARLATALGEARAAVDAAIARRNEREDGA